MLRKSKLYGLALSLLLLLGAPGMASAHVLKESNGISAVMHIEPDDNPYADKPVRIQFSFGDSANAFSLADCNCVVTIKHATHREQTKRLTPAHPGATLVGDVTVTFSDAGAYDIIISGSAKDGRFKSFTIDYPQRVQRSVNGSSSAGNGSDVLLIAVGSLAVLAVLAYNPLKQGKRYAAQTKPKKRGK